MVDPRRGTPAHGDPDEVVYMVERKGAMGRMYQIRWIRQRVLLKPDLWETIAV